MHAQFEEQQYRWMVVTVAGEGKRESAKLMLYGVDRHIAENYAKGFNRPKKMARYPHPRALVCRCQ